jgi:hypothetical protein
VRLRVVDAFCDRFRVFDKGVRVGIAYLKAIRKPGH